MSWRDLVIPARTRTSNKDLKWRVIVAGVEALIAAKGLRAEDVVLWCDWQSIYQVARSLASYDSS